MVDDRKIVKGLLNGQKLPCYTRSTLSHKDHHCNQPVIIRWECNTCCFHCSPAHYFCSWMAFHGMCHFCKKLTFRSLEVHSSVGNSQFPGWRHLSFAGFKHCQTSSKRLQFQNSYSYNNSTQLNSQFLHSLKKNAGTSRACSQKNEEDIHFFTQSQKKGGRGSSP